MLLHYKIWGEQNNTPLIILHGLLGSLGNWETLARRWSEHFQVIGVDQRNHGRSFHLDEMNYEVMAGDLKELLDFLKIKKCHILGHSMGGKTAMVFALQYPEYINKLIVADILPSATFQGHRYLFNAMKSLPLASINSRQEADEWLQSRIVSYPIRQFILKNLNRNESGEYQWMVNLDAIISSYEELMQFPQIGKSPFNGNTLFIKGTLSDYIPEYGFEEKVHPLFPHAKLKSIDEAGHWLHAEKPDELFNLVTDFLKFS